MEEQKQAEQQWNKIRRERINILKEAPSEENLWQAVMAFQDYPFKTVTGLPFQYTLKTGKNGEWTKELWIDRREKSKSLSWSSVVLAFKNSRKTTEMLGMEEQKGLAEYLKGNAKVKEVLQKKGDLTVIQGGKVHGNISSLMDESRMEELMTFLKSEFDYVIIDTPPAYLFSDAAILAGYVDCVLYVVRHDMAEIPQIEKGMESFIQEDKLLGYLINRSQKGFASYGKYGYGKYGYGKYGYGKYGKYQRYVDVKEDDMDTEDSL